MRTLLAAPLLLASLALGCLVPTVELAGRACDADHPCVDGYACSAEGTCLAGTPDASTEADAGVADAGSCARAYCDGQDYYTCEQGRPVLATTCAADARCDQARGCLAACGPEGQCPAGKVCDLASSGCVTLPSCSPELPCSSGQCTDGACVPTPGSTAEVSLGGGANEPAALDCYPGSLEPVAGASAAFKGFVLNALGKKTANTIGCTLVVFDAAEFASPSPAPLATTPIVDTPYQGPSGPESAGGFELAEIPTGTTLVAAVAGCDGAMPTYQYFSLPAAASEGSEITQDLVAFAPSEWQTLVASSGVTVGANRAGIAGQAFDCGDQPLRVSGATLALDTPGRAYYTYPTVLGIDPAAKATADTGRFFFFDVPAASLRVVAAERDADQDLRTQTLPVRTVPGAVTLLSLRPAGR